MAGFQKKGDCWFYNYYDENGVRRSRKGSTDKRVAQQLAAAAEERVRKIKAGLIDTKAEAIASADQQPIERHLAEWKANMLARGRNEKHAQTYFSRVQTLIGLTGAKRLSQLNQKSIQAALANLRSNDRSNQTVTHYKVSVRAFCRWLLANHLLRDDPTLGVSGYNPKEDIRHARRVLSDDELAKLIQAAESGPTKHGMSGPLRAMAYRVALGTGFRVSELRSLTPESFHLEGEFPTCTLKPRHSKNRQGAEQPIPKTLADQIRPWLLTLPPSKPCLLVSSHHAAKAVKFDLESAGIPYKTEEGFADFHSLRATYITKVVSSGADPKTAQTLARHLDIRMTLGVYAKANVKQLRESVNAITTFPLPKKPVDT